MPCTLSVWAWVRNHNIGIIKSRRQPVRWAGSPSAFCYLVSVAIAAGEKCRWQELWCAWQTQAGIVRFIWINRMKMVVCTDAGKYRSPDRFCSGLLYFSRNMRWDSATDFIPTVIRTKASDPLRTRGSWEGTWVGWNCETGYRYLEIIKEKSGGMKTEAYFLYLFIIKISNYFATFW